MTEQDYYEALEQVLEGAVTTAEVEMRRLARKAPTAVTREETLAASDAVSMTRRRLRVLVASGRETAAGEQVGEPRMIESALEVGELFVDPRAMVVQVGDEPVALAKKEFELLRTLASEPTRVFTKQELLRTVWGWPNARTRTLESHVSRLRMKLNGVPNGVFIHNVWGVGYRLVDQIPAAA